MVDKNQVCVNCSFSQSQVTACIAIVYHFNKENDLGNELTIHQINVSITHDYCFSLEVEQLYAVAVFGLLSTGLERVPIYTTVIELSHESTTTYLINGGSY